MASPMIFPPDADICCQCWGSAGGGTFDVTPDGYLMLTDVCFSCRWWETRYVIRHPGHGNPRTGR